MGQVGAESLLSCISVAYNAEWLGWSVEKYTDLEAVEKHAMNLFALNWFEYFETKTSLGTQMPEG